MSWLSVQLDCGEGEKSSANRKNTDFRGSIWNVPSHCTGWLLLVSAKPHRPSPSCYVHLSLSILPPPPVSANVSDSLSLCNPHLLGHFQVGPQAISIPKACTGGNNQQEKSERSNSGRWKHILPLFVYTTLRDTMDLKLRMNDQELVRRRSTIGRTGGTSGLQPTGKLSVSSAHGWLVWDSHFFLCFPATLFLTS